MNKLLKGMLYGALIGGAITLFDKKTREEVIEKGKTAGLKIKENVQNPKETFDNIMEKVDDYKCSFQEINEDLQFIVEKANELKEISEETTKFIADTKKVFDGKDE